MSKEFFKKIAKVALMQSDLIFEATKTTNPDALTAGEGISIMTRCREVNECAIAFHLSALVTLTSVSVSTLQTLSDDARDRGYESVRKILQHEVDVFIVQYRKGMKQLIDAGLPDPFADESTNTKTREEILREIEGDDNE